MHTPTTLHIVNQNSSPIRQSETSLIQINIFRFRTLVPTLKMQCKQAHICMYKIYEEAAAKAGKCRKKLINNIGLVKIALFYNVISDMLP